MAGKYAFTAEIQRSYMDGLGNPPPQIVDQTKLLEYCVRAFGMYAGKLADEYGPAPTAPTPNPKAAVLVFVKTEANWVSPMLLPPAQGPSLVSVRCGRRGTSSSVWEFELRQGDRLVGDVAITYININAQTQRPQPTRENYNGEWLLDAGFKDHKAQGIEIATK